MLPERGMDTGVEDMALGESHEDGRGDVAGMSDHQDILVMNHRQLVAEIMELKAHNCDLAARLAQTTLEKQDLSAQLLKYAAANQDLETLIASSQADNKDIRARNLALEEQVHYLQGLLRSSWSGGMISQDREADPTCMQEGENGIDDEQQPMDLDTARGLLVALQEFPIYINYCDKDLRYVWLSHTIRGYTLEELTGKRDDEVLPLENEGVLELVDLKRKALEKQQTQVREMTIDFPHAGRLSWMVTCKPHFSSNGEVVGVSTASIDITEKVEVRERLSKLHAEMIEGKANEGVLRRAVELTGEAIRAKNMFLAIMSHEIRTPLNGLLGMSEALAASDLTQEQRELVNAMLSSGVIISDILGDILDLASMESGAMELEEKPFSPADVVQDILKMALAATREKGISVTAEVSDNVPKKVISDALRIRQVLKYLVLNAIKFTQAGSVCIRLGIKEPSFGSSHVVGECKNLKLEEKMLDGGSLKAMADASPVVSGCKDLNSEETRLDRGSLKTMAGAVGRDAVPSSWHSEEPSPSSFGEVAHSSSIGQKRTHSKSDKGLESIEPEHMLKQSNVSMTSKLSSEGWLCGTDERRERGTTDFDGEVTPMMGFEKLDGCSTKGATPSANQRVPPEGSQEFLADNSSDLAPQQLLWCEIIDTGVGIPQESFATLFDTFTQVDTSTTRNFGGTGLGLAICKQLVELMGGQLTVTSEVGKGSTFTFSVICKEVPEGQSSLTNLSPIATTDSQVSVLSTERVSSTPRSLKGTMVETVVRSASKKEPRILLAEDNKVNVMVAISMLKRLGFTAQVVANGVEALEAIRREKYDLVLLDICMPLMDGLQVAYAIRQYEETGVWPEGDLRKIFESTHPLMAPENLDGSSTGHPIAKHVGSDQNLADALEGLTRTSLEGGRRLPIVAVTANALRSDVDKYYAHGMDAFIAKPVMFQKLRETLAKYLPIQPPASSESDLEGSRKVEI